MRTVKMLFILPMMAALYCGPVHAELVDRIVAVVNDEIITLSDLNAAVAQIRLSVEASARGQDTEKVLEEARRIMLGRLIDDSLLEQEAKKTGIVVRDEEVMETINNILSQKRASMEDLLKSIAKEGLGFDGYKKELRSQIMKMKLIRRDLKSKVMVGEEEIGDYYRRRRADYEGKEAVRIRQILLLTPDKATEDAKAKRREDAALLLKRLRNGEPFEQLAANYSQGPAASSGGDMGFIEKESMLPDVENAAFKLGINEVSDVIESPVGLHIVKLVDRRGAGIKPLEAVRGEIRAKIEEEKLGKKYEEWIEDIRKKSHIEIKR